MAGVAIVSGGTSGIGRAVAHRLAGDGFTVVAFGHDPAKVAALRADAGALDVREADTTDEGQVGELLASVRAQYGRIDVLCPAAGIKTPGGVLETDPETWDRVFGVNVRGAYLLTRAVLPTMVEQRSGAIVYIGSPSGYGGVDHAAYCASKGALHALATSVALDHVEDGIRVNTVVAGSTRTGMNRGRPEAAFERLGRANVASRVNDPEDVAGVVAFLASPAAATVSGARVEVGAVAGQAVLDRGGDRG